MPEKKEGLKVRRISAVIFLDDALDGARVAGWRHVMAKDAPAIAEQVSLKAGKLRCKLGGVSLIYQQDEGASIFGHARADSGINEGGVGEVFYDAIFISRADGSVGVDELCR